MSSCQSSRFLLVHLSRQLPHPDRIARAAREICGCLLIVAAAAPAAGDSGLDEIVVTATRLESSLRDVARSVSVVDRERIQSATQQLGLDEALAPVPGLYMQNRYNFSQDLRLSLRGFGARSGFGIRGVRIFVDDIPETTPDGQAQVDSIDLGSAERIEVLRGPSSALYGNAAGGVIYVQSELGTATPFVEARLAAGEFDYGRYQLKAGGSGGAFDYLLNASRVELDGYRDHSASKGDLLNARLGWDLSDSSRLLLSASYTDQPLAQDPGGIDAVQASTAPASARDVNVQFDAGEALEQERIGLLYRYDGSFGELMVRNYYVWRDFENLLPFTDGGAVAFQRFFYGAGVQYTIDSLLEERLRLTAGVDLDRQNDERQRYDNNDGDIGALVFDQDEDVSSSGVYLHAELQLTDRWALHGGLRRDRVTFDVTDRFLFDGDDSGTIDFDETSVSLGLSMDLAEGVLFANFGTSFETPTTTELANPDASGGFNESLRAQTADSIEVGYRHADSTWRYELAVFHMRIDDELVPFELAAFPGRTFYENAGESERNGIEVALGWQNEAGLNAQLSYTFSDFTFEDFVDDAGNDFSGNELPGLPRHFAYLSVGIESVTGVYGTLEFSYSGSLEANNANDVTVDEYLVSNLRLGYRARFGKWLVEPFAGVNNLANESYNSNIRINAFGGRYYEPAPVRHVYAGIVIRYE